MRSLVPCPSCNRHVESDATACPFCRTALVPSHDPNVCQGPCSGYPSPRLGRVALLAVGTTLLCAACMRSAIIEYGPAIIPDGGEHTVDSGNRADAGADALADAKK